MRVEGVVRDPFVQEWRQEKYFVEYLFEKLVCDVITPIIRPIIRFVGGRSTMTSLVEFSNFVLSEMEDALQVDAVYKDFSKAFDRVNHGLLVGTLTRKFCGPMIFWMGSYLTGHT
jgi:hypothetical protein